MAKKKQEVTGEKGDFAKSLYSLHSTELELPKGKILNEKFISVANKQLCNDMKHMKMIVESSTPPKFCNPSGWFQRTRLMPLHDRPPFTDFIVLYVPIRETSSEQDDAETR